MTKRNYYIFSGVVVLAMIAILFGILWEVNLRDQAAALLKDSNKTAQDIQKEKIADIKSQLAEAKQYEAANGCAQKDAQGQIVFCGVSLNRINRLQQELAETKAKALRPNSIRIQAVTANVQTLREDPTLSVTFQTAVPDPYLGGARLVEYYTDNKGVKYTIDRYTNNVILFIDGANSQVDFATSSKLSATELKRKAESYLSKHVSNFDQLKTGLSYSQSSKPGSTDVFFRWENSGKTLHDGTKPVLQVMLSARGDVLAFTNTTSYID